MLPTILMRPELASLDERSAARRAGFDVQTRRSVVQGSLVIGRYSVLPYYAELADDLKVAGGSLINSHQQHRWIADIGAWYEDFAAETPRTWLTFGEYMASGFTGPVVLKGRTNSRKQRWRTEMYAENQEKARAVWLRLLDDDLIYEQGIVVREFEEFDHAGPDISGAPITNEHRVFVLDGVPLIGGYYWSEHYDVVPGSFIEAGVEAVTYVRDKIATNLRARFVVADVARRPDGTWRLVELNDGQMSGLSCIDPGAFYAALAGRFS